MKNKIKLLIVLLIGCAVNSTIFCVSTKNESGASVLDIYKRQIMLTREQGMPVITYNSENNITYRISKAEIKEVQEFFQNTVGFKNLALMASKIEKEFDSVVKLIDSQYAIIDKKIRENNPYTEEEANLIDNVIPLFIEWRDFLKKNHIDIQFIRNQNEARKKSEIETKNYRWQLAKQTAAGLAALGVLGAGAYYKSDAISEMAQKLYAGGFEGIKANVQGIYQQAPSMSDTLEKAKGWYSSYTPSWSSYFSGSNK